jgi:hypothetical protein
MPQRACSPTRERRCVQIKDSPLGLGEPRPPAEEAAERVVNQQGRAQPGQPVMGIGRP